jgi:uncharacterized protein
MNKKHTALDYVVLALLVVGALNWGLVALMNLDLVVKLFGENTVLARVVYGLVGLSGLYALGWFFKKDNR